MRILMMCFLLLTSVCRASDTMELLISSEEISQKVREVAETLNEEYRD